MSSPDVFPSDVSFSKSPAELNDSCGSDPIGGESRRNGWGNPKGVEGSSASTHPYRETEEVRRVLESLRKTGNPATVGRLDEYEVLEVVGEGRMGVVLRAFDRCLDRMVAVKVMKPHLSKCVLARHRFSCEARAAARLRHPSIIEIHRIVTERRLPYVVTPWIEGDCLKDKIERLGPLGDSEILQITLQIASALVAAHGRGLFHLGIRPANVLLERGSERVALTGFGKTLFVRDSHRGAQRVVSGHAEFYSPEQCRGGAIDGRSDLFSLGSLIYAMCAGRPPFVAMTTSEVLHRVQYCEPDDIRNWNTTGSKRFQRLVNRLHSKNPEERMSKATAVHRYLMSLAGKASS